MKKTFRTRIAYWHDPRLIIGLSLIVASGALGGFILKGPETVAVYQAQSTIVPGTTISRASLNLVEISPELAQSYVGPKDAAKTDVIAKTIVKGELVTKESLRTSDSGGLRVVIPLLSPLPSSVDVGDSVRLWHVMSGGVDGDMQSFELTRKAQIVTMTKEEKIATSTSSVELIIPEDVAGDVLAILASDDGFVVTTGGEK